MKNNDLKAGKIWVLYKERGTLYLLDWSPTCINFLDTGIVSLQRVYKSLRFSSHVSYESCLTHSTMTSTRHFLATESLTHLSVQASAGSETPPEMSSVCLLHVVCMCVYVIFQIPALILLYSV